PVIFSELGSAGINAHDGEAPGRIAREQSAVVAAYVKHQPPGDESHEFDKGIDLAVQVGDHRWVQPGAIAVRLAIQFFGGERVVQLNETARLPRVIAETLDKLERTFG